VIPNGYDDSVFTLAEDERDLGLLFVGNLVPTKNVAMLLRAFARVRRTVNLPLTIVGDGFLRSSLTELAATLGILDIVHFLGVQSRGEVADLMARAHALVLPSLSESWGVVVAESLARGTPVVASRVGGVPEIVESGEGGILVTPGDEDALASALTAIARRRPDRRSVAAASRARPWSEQARHIAAVYASVLGAGPGGARAT
jgi:glycosyltransferase involved in cell wall biosynthesis